MTAMAIDTAGDLLRCVMGTAAFAGLPEPVELQPLPGGRNNRVYLVRTRGEAYVLKQYYRDADGHSERMQREYAFVSLLSRAGVSGQPRPLARNLFEGFALYSLLPGRAMQPNDVTPATIAQAAAFLNACRTASEGVPEAEHPTAAEACFSLAAHLELVDQRVAVLRGIEARDDTDAAAKRFIAERLVPTWHRVEANARALAEHSGLDPNAELPTAMRFVSPSDFGFHNALIDEAGAVRFCDFEYAGWDDPAKAVCDFLCQPRVPVPPRYVSQTLRQLLGVFAGDVTLSSRVAVLLPVYRIKWCCIRLNEFRPGDAARRAFADGERPDASRKAQQLADAMAALDTMTDQR